MKLSPTPNLPALSGYGDSYVVPGDEVYVVSEDTDYVYLNTGSNPPADGFNIVKAIFLPGVWRRASNVSQGTGLQGIVNGVPRPISVFGCRNFAEVRSITASASTLPAVLEVQCRATSGDHGGGVFRLQDTLAPDDDGIVLRTASGAAYVREYYGLADARWFGVIAYADPLDSYGPNGGIDSTQAINNALAAQGMVQLPAGAIRLVGTIAPNRIFGLHGHGAAITSLYTDNTATALVLTEGVADRSMVQGLTIRTFTPHAGVRGIVVRANGVKMRDVSVFSVGGHGVQVGQDSANSSGFRFYDLSFGSCGGDGLYVFYGNAGEVYGIDVLNGGGYGFRDESNLGNRYFGGHIEATAMGYKIGGGTSRTQVFGVYSEAPGCIANAPAMVFGGLNVGSWNPEAYAGNCIIFEDVTNVAPFRMHSGSGTSLANLLLGSADGLPSAFGWSNPVPYSVENYRLFWKYAERLWRLSRARSDGDDDTVFEHTAFGHELSWSNMRIPNALIGSGTRPNGGGKGVRVTSGTALPSSGTWYLGFRHLHSDPAPGEWKEVTCVVQGGWPNTTRANSTNVGRYATIEPVAGHLWECVVDSGFTASSPPVFTPGQTVVDGQVNWRYHGVVPPIFE